MWWDVILDLFMPDRDLKKAERRSDGKDAETIRILDSTPGGFKQRLNETGWLHRKVLAAGVLQQGKMPSMAAMVTGVALVEIMRPRRVKSLPREFCVAVTDDRVIAYAMSPWREGDGNDRDHIVKVRRDERGSWPRAMVRLLDAPNGAKKGGMLDVDGMDPFPVRWEGDPSTNELVEALSR